MKIFSVIHLQHYLLTTEIELSFCNTHKVPYISLALGNRWFTTMLLSYKIV